MILLSFTSTLEIRQTERRNHKKMRSLRLRVLPKISNDSIMGSETKWRYRLSCPVSSVRKRWRTQTTHVDFVHSPGLERTETWAHARLYYLMDPDYTVN